MIKINLLKTFATGGADNSAYSASMSDRDQILLQVAKRLAVVFIGPLILLIYEYQSLPVLKKKVSNVQVELAETTTFNQSKSGLAAEIKKYEEELAKINAQMAFINRIARDKINEYKLFQHLQNSTPESVWINRLEFKDNILMISIESDVAEDLNKFSVRLSNTEFLTNIVPTDQAIKVDPFLVGVNTTTQNLKAQFNSQTGAP